MMSILLPIVKRSGPLTTIPPWARRKEFNKLPERSAFYLKSLITRRFYLADFNQLHSIRLVLFLARILAASATVIIRVMGSAGDGINPCFS
jgi:hypothetical protein